MNTVHHFDRIAEYLRREELWLLLAEKLVVDSDRRQLVSTPSFLRSGITLCSDEFTVLKIDILYQILSENRINMQVEDGDDHLLGRRLQRNLWELIPDRFVAYPFIHAGETYMLLNYKEPVGEENSPELDKALREIYDACQRFVAQTLAEMNLKIRVYIGPYVPSMDKMKFKFETLSNMAKVDCALTENSDVIMPPHVWMMYTPDPPRTMQIKALTGKMFHYAMEHHFDEALAAANAIIEEEASNYDTALSLPIRMGSRVECLFDILGIPPVVSSHSSLKAYAYKEALLEATSTLDLKETVSKIFSDFEEYFTPTSSVPVKNRIDEICQYIQNNYSDPNLCSDMICREFGISGAYLSRLFKEQMGIKLIDYIHHLRVDEAARLLRDTACTVEQIALTVGYQSALTLTRAYKRYFDMSPGSARKKQ